MKFSYKVLKKHLPFLISPQDLAEKLVMYSCEVEGIENIGKHLENVFVGEIKSFHKHPNADKLNICQVFVNGETRQIICGAPNVTENLKVAVALPGAELKPGFIIKKSEIRGEESNGMLCALDELSLEDEKQYGIWEMPKDAILGTPLKEYLGLDDHVLEIDNKSINHRPDMFSYVGAIREIGSIFGEKTENFLSLEDFSNLENLNYKNEIPEKVARYTALKIENVSNISSKEDILQILKASGNNSKGVLVDISNFSLYFFGQPMHFFDADKIEGKISVRYAKNGEKLLALNDKEYELSENDIVIADEKKVVGLAGIIGGKNSAVSETTKSVIIESANFPQDILRKTGKKLGIRTDALNVFEKDIPADLTIFALSAVYRKLLQYFPDLKLSGFSDSYNIPQKKYSINYSLSEVERLSGHKFEQNFVDNILENIGIKNENSVLEIPFYRTDLQIMADITEEIVRIYGYNNIASTPLRIISGAVVQNKKYLVKRKLIDLLAYKGLTEVYNYSFVSKKDAENFGVPSDKLVNLKKPLSEELEFLRPNLLINLLHTIGNNYREYSEIKAFELEKTFVRNGDKVLEGEKLGIIISSSEKEILYFDLQKIVSEIFFTFGIKNYKFEVFENPFKVFQTGRVAKIFVNNEEIGFIGEVSSEMKKNFDIKNIRVATLEIDFEKFVNFVSDKFSYKEISNFQENSFDINFVISKENSGNKLQEMIEKIDKENVNKVEIIDIYEDEAKLPGKRSVTFKIYIQSLEKTLDDEYKNSLIENIIGKASKLGAEIRQ